MLNFLEQIVKKQVKNLFFLFEFPKNGIKNQKNAKRIEGVI